MASASRRNSNSAGTSARVGRRRRSRAVSISIPSLRSPARRTDPPDPQRQGEADGAAALRVAPGLDQVAPEGLDGFAAERLLRAPHRRPGLRIAEEAGGAPLHRYGERRRLQLVEGEWKGAVALLRVA